MCQSKAEGGRRCSAHAREALSKAITTGDITKIEKAQDEYNRTPAGIKSLRESGEGVLAAKYEKEREMRARLSVLAHSPAEQEDLRDAINDEIRDSDYARHYQRGGWGVESLTIEETADGKARIDVGLLREVGEGDSHGLTTWESYLAGADEDELNDADLPRQILEQHREQLEELEEQVLEGVMDRARASLRDALGDNLMRNAEIRFTPRSGVDENDVERYIDSFR